MSRSLTISLILSLLTAGPALGQSTAPDSVRPGGVLRASAVVDSVFVDRLVPEGFVAPGDWASYLMARLGIYPVPPDLKIAVLCDTDRIAIQTRVGDLPPEAKAALGPIVGMLPPQTVLGGDISLTKVAREVVRFRLEAIRVNGVPLPEGLVAAAMMNVGRQYPALTKSGRVLFVEVPRDAGVELRSGRVRLVGPPPDSVPARP